MNETKKKLKKKIIFLTSAHKSFDDRIFFHQAITLVRFGFEVQISSSLEFISENRSGVYIRSFEGQSFNQKRKVEKFVECLIKYNPDLIICSEPLPIYSSLKFRKRKKLSTSILYDITEWYPSKKNIRNLSFSKKLAVSLKLFSFNLIMSSKVDGFIFGELSKGRFYQLFYPNKKHELISYYPSLKYICHKPANLKKGQINLCYTGVFSEEKGFLNFLNVAKLIARKAPQKSVFLKLIGNYQSDKERLLGESLLTTLGKNIFVEKLKTLPFRDYLKAINNVDVFFDLRSNDYENQRCLPIKIFYYAASGRPVVYSDLKAIREEIEVKEFGYLVDPLNYDKISDLVLTYYSNPELHKKHCNKALELSRGKYNWEVIEDRFLKFIELFV